MGTSIGRGALAAIDIVLGQGQTNSFQLVWKPDGEAGQDLSGWSARMQARKRAGADPAWFTISSDEGSDGSIVLGADGSVLITVFPETSARWGTVNRSGVWDLELIDPDGAVVTFARGAVTVELEVTTHGDGA